MKFSYYVATLWGANHKPYIGVRPLNHAGEEYTLGNWRFSDSIPCWTWPGHEGKTTQIEVFSEGSEVELICAGSTQRKALVNCCADFEGSYVPGVLTAISYDSEGNEIARAELKTANNETVLCVEPEESELTNLVFVPISLRDSNGILRMTSDAEITVSVEGPVKLIAFGCAKPDSEPNYYCGRSTTWNGRALAVIQSVGTPGTVRITASASGLESAAAEIIAK